MNSRHAMIAAAGFLSLSGLSMCFGGGRSQPSAPAIPPSFAQNQRQNPQQQNAPSQQASGQPQTTNPDNSGSSNNSNNSGGSPRKRDRRQYPYGYPYANPYGYGQPQAGVYYPNGSPSGTNGNPNAAPQNNPNANAPAPGLFAPPPAADNTPATPPAVATPPTPPDPEVIQATADLNAAMDQLRATLMKTNPDYQAAVADKKAAQAETAALRSSDQPVAPEAILASATRGLQAATKVTQIERDAAAADQAVQDAQSKLRTVMAAHAGTK